MSQILDLSYMKKMNSNSKVSYNKQHDECKINASKHKVDSQPKQQARERQWVLVQTITAEKITFLTRLAWLTCICFPLTGIPAICLSRNMRKAFQNNNHDKALSLKFYVESLVYITILCSIIALVVLIVRALSAIALTNG